MAAVEMGLESYRQRRYVKWDKATQRVVPACAALSHGLGWKRVFQRIPGGEGREVAAGRFSQRSFERTS